MEAKQSFKVTVKSLDDVKTEYHLPRGTLIGDLVIKISAITRIPLDHIRLIYKNKNLQGNQKIEDIVSGDNEVFEFVGLMNRDSRKSRINMGQKGVNADPLDKLTNLLSNNGQMGSNFAKDIKVVCACGRCSTNLLQGPNLNSEFCRSFSGGDTNSYGGSTRLPVYEFHPKSHLTHRPFSNMQHPSNYDSTDSDIRVSIVNTNQEKEILKLDSNIIKHLATLHETSIANRPDIPVNPEVNDTANILSNYLRSVSVSLYNFLPVLDRSIQLLENEKHIVGINERTDATEFVQRMGKFFEIYGTLFNRLKFFNALDFSNKPGFLLIDGTKLTKDNSLKSQTTDVTTLNHSKAREILKSYLNIPKPTEPKMQPLSTYDHDFITIIAKSLPLDIFTDFAQGIDTGIIHYHRQIKEKYDKIVAQCNNNKEELERALLSRFTDAVADAIKSMKPYLDPVTYMPKLKNLNKIFIDAFIKEFSAIKPNTNEVTSTFIPKYTKYLSAYTLFVTWEVSKAMQADINDTVTVLADSVFRYFDKIAKNCDYKVRELIEILITVSTANGQSLFSQLYELYDKGALDSRVSLIQYVDDYYQMNFSRRYLLKQTYSNNFRS